MATIKAYSLGHRMTGEVYCMVRWAESEVARIEDEAQRARYGATHQSMKRYRYEPGVLHRLLIRYLEAHGLDAYAMSQVLSIAAKAAESTATLESLAVILRVSNDLLRLAEEETGR